LVAAGDDVIGPGFDQAAGHRLAQPLAAAGDERHFTAQVEDIREHGLNLPQIIQTPRARNASSCEATAPFGDPSPTPPWMPAPRVFPRRCRKLGSLEAALAMRSITERLGMGVAAAAQGDRLFIRR